MKLCVYYVDEYVCVRIYINLYYFYIVYTYLYINVCI